MEILQGGKTDPQQDESHLTIGRRKSPPSSAFGFQ